MIAIVAMDLIGGSCVRLRMGDYASKRVYSRDPVETARMFADCGLRRLHLVDLDGAREGHVVNHGVLRRIAEETPLVIDAGGGLKSERDFETVFDCGASMATVGSLAACDRSLTLRLLRIWGSEKLMLGADCRNGMIAVSGWEETTDLPLHEFVARYLQEGFTTVVSTDISRDGMLGGPAVGLYQDLMAAMERQALKMDLIASGGIRSLSDLDVLQKIGLDGAIVGRAIYEGAVGPAELAAWQTAAGRMRYVGEADHSLS